MRTCIATFALVILSLTPAWAGGGNLTLRLRTTSSDPADPPREQMQYTAGGKRISDDARARSIIDLDAKTMTIIDKGAKTYFVTTFDALRMRNEALAQRLDTLPPQARAILGLGKDVAFKPTGKTQKIAGHQAREYAVEGGPTTGTLWVTDTIDLGPRAQEWADLAELVGATSNLGGQFANAYARLKGIPLRTSMTSNLDPRKTVLTTEVVEITTATPPAGVARIPAGFKETTAPSLMP